MTKELVTIEFRYTDKPKNEDYSENRNTIITIGIYDTFDEAIIEGNNALEIFESKFKLNKAYNKKERFSKNGGCFGLNKRLITQLGYLQTPFEFYAKITQLTYADVNQTIDDVLAASKRFNDYKISKLDE